MFCVCSMFRSFGLTRDTCVLVRTCLLHEVCCNLSIHPIFYQLSFHFFFDISFIFVTKATIFPLKLFVMMYYLCVM